MSRQLARSRRPFNGTLYCFFNERKVCERYVSFIVRCPKLFGIWAYAGRRQLWWRYCYCCCCPGSQWGVSPPNRTLYNGCYNDIFSTVNGQACSNLTEAYPATPTPDCWCWCQTRYGRTWSWCTPVFNEDKHYHPIYSFRTFPQATVRRKYDLIGRGVGMYVS